MPILLSTALNVAPEALAVAGAFDGFIDLDSQFHVDPHLLASCEEPEFAGARVQFDDHFRDVFKLLTTSKAEGDVFWKGAVDRLTFREIPNTGLGYARKNKAGSAIGPDLAAQLARLASEIAKAGYIDPDIFDLVGLFQENIGADRISDMTVAIILPNILAYSQRVAIDLALPTVEVGGPGGAAFKVPSDPSTGDAVYLLPYSVLRHLPVAESWSDVDVVAAHNAALRAAVNGIIGETWKSATRAVAKNALRKTVLNNPELIGDILTLYRAKPADAYDFAADPDLLLRWPEETAKIAAAEPLQLALATPEEAAYVVRKICERFKKLIEVNRLSKLLFTEGGKPRPEKTAQLVFFGIADAYCRANNLDLSPEVDSGAGPVDFKISSGSAVRVNVEIKLSSNSKLVQGFQTQLPAYDDAEESTHSFYVVIQTTATDASIKRVQEAARAWKDAEHRIPEIITVDGRLKPSASKLDAG